MTMESQTTEIKKVRKWGNGLGILLPKSLIRGYNLESGDELALKLVDGKYILEPATPTLNIPDYNLEDLLKVGERVVYDWDSYETVGREV